MMELRNRKRLPSGNWAVTECTKFLRAVARTVFFRRQVASTDDNTVSLRWREQGSTDPFDTGPIATLPAGTSTATASVTVTTANPGEVVARVILSSGGQFDSAPVLV
jgi:hypothetical protein